MVCCLLCLLPCIYCVVNLENKFLVEFDMKFGVSRNVSVFWFDIYYQEMAKVAHKVFPEFSVDKFHYVYCLYFLINMYCALLWMTLKWIVLLRKNYELHMCIRMCSELICVYAYRHMYVCTYLCVLKVVWWIPACQGGRVV